MRLTKRFILIQFIMAVVHRKICLSKYIRSIRTKNNMTQKSLGEKAGLSPSYISDLECARRGIRFVNLCRLAQGLGVSVSELLDFDDDVSTDEVQ